MAGGTTKGSIRWAPWPGPGGAFQVRIRSAPSKTGLVSVRWQGGPLKGQEANLELRTLRSNRRDAALGDIR